MYTNKEIWNVSYPIFLGLLAQNIINVTDTAFLGRVGEVELGASAMGGLFYICVFTIAFGFSVGSQILIARRNGEGRYKDVGPVMIQGGTFLLGLAMLMFGLTHLLAPSIVRLLISSDSIFDATMEFLNWRIWGFFFAFVNVMFRALYIGITRTKVLTMNAVVMALVNVLLDYILIFGKFGMPEMGIKGAAVASVMAEAASLAFFLIYTYAKVDFKKFGLNHWQKIDFSLLGKILSISCFTMIQYFLAMATWFVFFIAIERLGQRELAIANIVRSIYIVMLIPVQALSTTTNSLVSNLIGAGGDNPCHAFDLAYSPDVVSHYGGLCGGGGAFSSCHAFGLHQRTGVAGRVCAFVVCHCRSDDCRISGEYLFQCHFGNWKYAGCSDT